MVSYNTYYCYEHTHTLHLQESCYTSIVPIPKYITKNYNLHTQYKNFIMLCFYLDILAQFFYGWAIYD